MTDFKGVNEGQRVSIVSLDIPYLNLLAFCFKFILAWVPCVLVFYALIFLFAASCAGVSF